MPPAVNSNILVLDILVCIYNYIFLLFIYLFIYLFLEEVKSK